MPPDQVIVREDSSVGWSSETTNVTGDCAHGLNSTTIVITSQSSSTSGKSIQASGFTIKDNPGNIFTLTASPTANAARSAGGGGGLDSVGGSRLKGKIIPYVIGGVSFSAGINYKATVTIVSVNLTKTFKYFSKDSIIIGQGCTASLSAPGYVLSSYLWTISGDTFADYIAHNAHVVNGVRTEGEGRVIYLTDDDRSKPAPKWYWRSVTGAGDESVEKVTASANIAIDFGSLGVLPVGRMTVSRRIQLLAPPDAGITFTPESGTVKIYNAGQQAVAPVLKAMDNSDGLGISWKGNIASSAGIVDGKGKWHTVQLIYPGLSYSDDQNTLHKSPNYGLPGLDNSYPYMPDNGLDAADNGDFGYDDNGTVVYDAAYDSPELPLLPTYKHVNANEQCEMYMMWRPYDAGNGAKWVPLVRTVWKWTSDVDRPTSGWTFNLPRTVGSVTIISSGRWKKHPEWSRAVLNNDPLWAN